jgi:hypothetical protein
MTTLLECHAASGHHLLEYCLFPTGRLNLGFITERKLAAIFIKTSLGVSNWPVILLHQQTQSSFIASSSPRHQQVFWCRCRGLNYIFPRQLGTIKQQSSFLAPLPGKKKTSRRGVSHAHPLLYFMFCFTLFLLASFYQKHKKNSFLYSCYFITSSSLCCSLSMFWRTSQ